MSEGAKARALVLDRKVYALRSGVGRHLLLDLCLQARGLGAWQLLPTAEDDLLSDVLALEQLGAKRFGLLKCRFAIEHPSTLQFHSLCEGLTAVELRATFPPRTWLEPRDRRQPGRDLGDMQAAIAGDIPMHRVGQPDDIQALALFLASPASA